ncbi:unnamed protein product [Bursaphelenchus okinawaensis]|uniref:Uncharacterized protein n=1 Tax=Bursaphelenchus okinawaensis TaxID=465554 RepID=A0A811JV69_9BILA|nr:unnamed protein product [Bursaphelenchus okinawaensis]CAG9084560.1 unnamed protein product [Bursaphelenchus okinawaensis]
MSISEYRRNPKSNTGQPSSLLEECQAFSLDDEAETVHVHIPSTHNGTNSKTKLLKQDDKKPNGHSVMDNRWSNQATERRNHEISPLTDEIDLGRDSDSDDLDLLPVVTQSTAKNKESKKKWPKLLQCCSPYWVRPRCTIM